MKTQKFGSKIVQRIQKIGSIAALFMGAAMLFLACENNDLAEIKALSAPGELPIMEAENFETTLTDSGQVRFTLKTPKLLRFENEGKSYTEFPVGMEIVKYDADHNIVSSISADYAKEFLKEEKWEAKNNVVVTNADGDSLKTEHLIWDEKKQKIYTEEFVKIISENKIITGVGLVSDQDMLNWKIKNPKGTIYVSVNEKASPESTEPSDVPAHKSEPPVLPRQQQSNKAIQFK